MENNKINVANLSEDELSRLAEGSGLGLINWDVKTDEITMNSVVFNLVGHEYGVLPHSKNTRDKLIYKDDRPMTDAIHRDILSCKIDNYNIEYRMVRKDGGLVWISEYAIVTEKDKDGKPLRISAMCRDISGKKWMERRNRQLELEIKMLPHATDDDLMEQNHILRAVSSSANMIVGGYYSNYELVLKQAIAILAESIGSDRAYIWRNSKIEGKLGCHMRSCWAREQNKLGEINEAKYYLYGDFLPEWKEFSDERQIIVGTKSQLPQTLSILPGFEFLKSTMIIPLFIHGEFWGFISFDDCEEGRIYTNREAEIMKTGSLTIAASITRWEMNVALQKTHKAAVATTKAKSEFLSRMSHEIRTPMNAIIGMTSIAERTDDATKIKYCLEKVQTASRQLLSIINDILDMSKIDANKFEITESEFDFENMIQDVFNVIQVKMEEKHQKFNLDIQNPFKRKVISDELRISQVLINLLNNAVKFTPEKGTITLKVRERTIDDDRSNLTISVIDTGIGISEEGLQKLFNDFEQVDGSITRSYGGTGLGLSICKKIAELMDGDIWVESEPGHGSIFGFSFDVKWGDEAIPVIPRKMLKEDIHALVVDDSVIVLEYFKNILKSFSMECDVANNGATALHMLRERKLEGNEYDIFFLDWNLPDMNGGAVAQEIRKMTNDNAIIVMISSSDWSDIEKEAMKFGIDNFLPKPVLPSVLFNTVLNLTNTTPVYDEEPVEEKEYKWPDKKILIVEDIEINIEILKNILSPTEIGIDHAENGKIAVDLIAKNPEEYDLILMDVQMPVMDGLEATRQIRAMNNERAKNMPIIAMTANAFKEDEEISIGAGMNGHLTKPLSVEELYSVLEKYFE